MSVLSSDLNGADRTAVALRLRLGARRLTVVGGFSRMVKRAGAETRNQRGTPTFARLRL
jgi:hypothetical protein